MQILQKIMLTETNVR